MSWKVRITKQAAKRAKKLPKGPMSAFRLLWKDLEKMGPVQRGWPNFGKLEGKGNDWHCHLKKGKPTYVACWRSRKYSTAEREEKENEGEIEIYYAWSHEKAPY